MIALSILALGLSCQAGPPPFSPASPPWIAWPKQTQLRPTAQADRDLLGSVELSTSRKLLTIEWSFDGESDQRLYDSQAFDLSYWPTAAVEVNGALIVAGVRSSNGNTVIERWTLDCPAPPFTAHSSYSASVGSVQTVYDQRSTGKTGARFLMKNHGSTKPLGEAFIQYVDSNRIEQLDLSNGQVVRVVWTPQDIPILTHEAWRYVWAGEHPLKGYVYVYGQSLAEHPLSETLVLLDTQKDGEIDEWYELSSAEWQSLLGPPASWTQIF